MDSFKPVNTKSLLAFTFSQMVKLDNKEISVQEANAQANLINSAMGILDYELKRAIVQTKLGSPNIAPAIRQIESKGFD